MKKQDIERIALEFVAQAPRVAAFTNRGAGAHYNGFHTERAVVLLNAVIGNVGEPGGYCYGEAEKIDPKVYPPPIPVPPPVKIRTDLEDPPEWPLSNKWQKMRVGHLFGGRAASGQAEPRQNLPSYENPDDDAFEHDLWWSKKLGGRGNGTNINAVLPINPSPLVGMQGWFDTVCTIRKV